jgi:hypothetical protein
MRPLTRQPPLQPVKVEGTKIRYQPVAADIRLSAPQLLIGVEEADSRRDTVK